MRRSPSHVGPGAHLVGRRADRLPVGEQAHGPAPTDERRDALRWNDRAGHHRERSCRALIASIRRRPRARVHQDREGARRGARGGSQSSRARAWSLAGTRRQGRGDRVVSNGGRTRKRGTRVYGSLVREIPAASYSPRGSTPKYHRRWRA